MLFSEFNASSIDAALGAPEYSYWFVRRVFAPVLERYGIVIQVTDPEREVDAVCRSAAAQGQDSVFFSFEPPHKTVLGLGCPTIPVFAWEFNTIPNEIWDEDPRNDWRTVLAATGCAITHSAYGVAAIKRGMGGDYPVWRIPAPVYDAHAPYAATARPVQPETDITLSGGIAIDSHHVNRDVFSMRRSFAEGLGALRALARYLERPDHPPQRLRLSGVIYTAIFNPIDGRKNFNDLLGAFIWAFRNVDDATLILKITHFDPVRGMQPVLADIAKHGEFRCRIILIHGMLPDAEYRALLCLTSYTVNTSTNEGQCLPLMEFMSAGRPAVAPCHTAMEDYISPDNAFIVRSTVRPYNWPHDPRQAIRTVRYALSVGDLIRAYRESYRVAKQEPERYAAMSRAANAALQGFCATDIVADRLAEVLRFNFPAVRGAAPQPALA